MVAVWATGAGTVGLAIGVILAWSSLKDARQTRHAQLLADFSTRWDAPEIIESLRLGREYGPQGLRELTTGLFGPNATRPSYSLEMTYTNWQLNQADWYECVKWPTFLETIGVMVFNGAIPSRMVYQMWGGPIVFAWNEEWQSVAALHRFQKHDPNIFRYFQWLAERMEDERDAEDWARLRQTEARRTGPVGAAISAASGRSQAVLWARTQPRGER